ncbi:acyl-CoA synthetase [Rhodococcus sp. SGAir0479]|uniref:acyl-CoA synthetase n=1 Tax=Rhodococcus sp. SGAir0479 TaxID=2567884 RepID=UPI0010CCD169|nr:acyl-CoA synthetase [Rhodococcus sp. SGAir0479]QCQ92931.1 acyl-CoA synthetase [Rhodococcus sp. SGAir0479]
MSEDPRTDTVDGILRRAAARQPGRTALTFGDRSWTYRELDDAVTRAAGSLLALGLGSGDRVAGYGVNSDAYVIGFLACARAGLVHVPVNYALTGDELHYLLAQSGARAVLVDPALRAGLEAVRADLDVEHVVPLRDEAGALVDAVRTGVLPELGVRASGSDLAQLLYTSGTTSKPKGAMMSHGALVHEYVSAVIALGLDADDNPLVCMPLYHSAAMHVFMLPYLSVGATVHLMQSPDIPEILRRIEVDRIGSLFLAPTVWVPLAGHPDLDARDLSSLKKAQYGASIMPVTVLGRLRERYPALGFYNCFGQSEIGPLATVLGPGEHEDRPSSCGRAVYFVEARVVDPDGNDVPDGEPGEILYRSPQLCNGYWDNPEATAEAFRDGWFHSGDMVTRDAGGYITVVDRIKDVINTGGILVASREVEDALYTHPGVAEVAVIGVPDEKWIEAVTAVVVLREDADPEEVTAEVLVRHVRERIAPFKVPKRIRFVEALPRNQSGKLLKRALRGDLDPV